MYLFSTCFSQTPDTQFVPILNHIRGNTVKSRNQIKLRCRFVWTLNISIGHGILRDWEGFKHTGAQSQCRVDLNKHITASLRHSVILLDL